MYTPPAGAFGTWSATPRCLFLPTVNVQLSGRAIRASYWFCVARMSMLHDVGRGGDGERDYETFTGQTRCGLHHTQLGVSTSVLSHTSSSVEDEVACKSVTVTEFGACFNHL